MGINAAPIALGGPTQFTLQCADFGMQTDSGASKSIFADDLVWSFTSIDGKVGVRRSGDKLRALGPREDAIILDNDSQGILRYTRR